MADIPSTPLVPAKRLYPYDDEYMIFDKTTGRYILTEKCVIERIGIDLSARLNERNGINPTALIQRYLKRTSTMVYNYIHQHNDSRIQDLLIAKVPSLRRIIQEALEDQFLYIATVGDISLSTDKEKRELSIDKNCKEDLLQTVPELGTTILYTGDLLPWTYWIC